MPALRQDLLVLFGDMLVVRSSAAAKRTFG